MKNHYLILLCLAIFAIQPSFAQIGGQNTYEFLNLPTTARIAALGGNLITVKDDDGALAFHNPSLLNSSMHNQITFSNSFYFAGINHGYAGYTRYFNSINMTFSGGLQYVNYGDFTGADETGFVTGEFSASEYALTFGAGYQYSEHLSLGANLKTIYSQFESYNSLGLATDLGITYQDTAKRLAMTFVLKNMGAQLISYNRDTRENLPFDVQIGISKQLRYLPFRVSVIAHNLYKWDIRYEDPNVEVETNPFGEPVAAPNKFAQNVDNLFRHIIFNGELLLGKMDNFRLRIGYNHLRRAELSVNNTVSFAGFSFGVGFKVKNFRLDYGRGTYHLAGGTNSLTISTNLSDFK